jgi:ArsR family transcriptional regulator, arsenate/arsenite/antimonite-responsive transcriptional repressor
MVQSCNNNSTARRRAPQTPRQAAQRPGRLEPLLNVDLFKALADPMRARLLACVARCGRGCSVGEIAECCDLDLSTVSRHLAVLARAGAMHSTKRGTTVLYTARNEHLSRQFRDLAAALDDCCVNQEGCDAC